jgi:hypothetical protein
LLRDKAPEKFPRAGLRWDSHYVREIHGVELDEGQAVLATLAAIGGSQSKAAAFALADLLSGRRGLEQACQVLVAWSRR